MLLRRRNIGMVPTSTGLRPDREACAGGPRLRHRDSPASCAGAGPCSAPPRGPHQRPCAAVLACPSVGPPRRDPERPHLGRRSRGPADLHVGVFTGPGGVFRPRTKLPAEQKAILTALGLRDPPRVLAAPLPEQQLLLA